MHTTTTPRRIVRDWHRRGVTVSTISTHGPVERGTIRALRGAWYVTDIDGVHVGTLTCDYLDAEAALFAATPALD